MKGNTMKMKITVAALALAAALSGCSLMPQAQSHPVGPIGPCQALGVKGTSYCP
jgi:hypothetical protein